MTLETDALADAALRFSEAIRAERASTFDALAAERQAALQIIDALRLERAARARTATGRFVFGVALGVASGIATIYFVSQRASEEARLGLTAGSSTLAVPELGAAGPAAPEAGLMTTLRERFQRAVADGKKAMQGREAELWQRYRQRVVEGQQPPPKPDDFMF